MPIRNGNVNGNLSYARSGDVLPTFLGIGAARGGTSSLRRWFKQHPQVFLPDLNEIGYFTQSRWGEQEKITLPAKLLASGWWQQQTISPVLDWAGYRSLFVNGHDFLARGEISPSYLYFPGTAERIQQVLPEVKILVVLRDPVERAVSHYRLRRELGETGIFLKAEAADANKRNSPGFDWATDFAGAGLYADGVGDYIRQFGRDRVGVWLFEALRSDPAMVFASMCDFIGVDRRARHIQLPHENASSGLVPVDMLRVKKNRPRLYKAYQRLLTLPGMNGVERISQTILRSESIIIDQGVVKELEEFYRSDVERLRELLPELDFSGWLNPKAE